MKTIKYNHCTKVNHGTKENPVWGEILSAVEMGWNEANEAIAKAEAFNGEYTIEDDGIEEVTQPTQEERLAKLEKAIEDIPALIKNAIKSAFGNL